MTGIMKVKKNEVLFLIALLGVLAAIGVYVWVYMPTKEKTVALEDENKTQATYLAQLESWAGQVEHYKEETVTMIQEVNETFMHFPADSKAPDAIMYAVELEAQDPQTYISNIGLTQPEVVYESAPTSVRLNDTQEGSQERTYRLFCQQITYTQEFTYNGMKRYVNAIVNNTNRRSIDTLNMAYDTNTGILVGTTAMNLYTIDGTDKEYRKTAIPSMQMGTNNIFRSLE